MIVFKCYMKILRQNVTLVIIYLGIFFSVALVMQMAAGKSEDSLYANTSIDIGAVSYTHLDVYKRQHSYWVLLV